MTILEYMDTYGAVSFEEQGLNEVDNVVFAELAYVEMDGFISPDSSRALTVAQLCERFLQTDHALPRPINDPVPILRKAAQTPRYQNVMVCFYSAALDEERHCQFAAVTFLYSRNEAYIAFRGTDDTIVGWREDFNLSFLEQTPGQRMAVEYLTNVAAQTNGRLTLGGHSKGGNFAVYAAAFCDPAIRDERIDRVYSDDGPGFLPEVVSSEAYAAIVPKTVKLIPDSSIVGILLNDRVQPRFITSSIKGVMQHDPNSWLVEDTRFQQAEERSPFSLFVGETLGNWLTGLETHQRRTLVNVFFDSLQQAGIRTLTDWNRDVPAAYRAFRRAMRQVDDAQKGEVQQILRQLLLSGIDVMISGRRSAGDSN